MALARAKDKRRVDAAVIGGELAPPPDRGRIGGCGLLAPSDSPREPSRASGSCYLDGRHGGEGCRVSCLCGAVVRGQKPGDDGRPGECHCRGDGQADAQRRRCSRSWRRDEVRCPRRRGGARRWRRRRRRSLRLPQPVCRECVGRTSTRWRTGSRPASRSPRRRERLRPGVRRRPRRRDAGLLLWHGADDGVGSGAQIEPIESARPKNTAREASRPSRAPRRDWCNSAARPTRPSVTTRVVRSRATSLMLDPAPIPAPAPAHHRGTRLERAITLCVLQICVSAKTEPNSEKDATLMVADATLKRGSRKNERSSIGSGVRNPSHERSDGTAAVAKQPTRTGLVQPDRALR